MLNNSSGYKEKKKMRLKYNNNVIKIYYKYVIII